MWESVITSHLIVKEKYVCSLQPVKLQVWMTQHLYQDRGNATIQNQVTEPPFLHYVNCDS